MSENLKRKVLGYLVQYSNGKVMLFKNKRNYYSNVLRNNEGFGCPFPDDIGDSILKHDHTMTETIEAGRGWE